MQVAPKSSEPRHAGKFGQVLQFPQRRLDTSEFTVPGAHTGDSNLADDLARYELEDEPVNYRQRALMNFIAVVIVTLLVASGVWIADTIMGVGRTQECVMQGRMNCAPIEVPVPNRQ
jgi:hypothetical protein